MNNNKYELFSVTINLLSTMMKKININLTILFFSMLIRNTLKAIRTEIIVKPPLEQSLTITESHNINTRLINPF